MEPDSTEIDDMVRLADRILIMHGGAPVAILPATSIDRETLLAVTTTGIVEEAA